MKKIVFFILFSSLSLFADGLPNSSQATVTKVSNGTIELSSNIPAGMSGIVIHNYGNKLSAITHDAISLGNQKASIQEHSAISHKNIPSIQTEISVGDTVVFGNFYKNVLLIAPNQRSYSQITSQFKRTWIHPDVFAVHFMDQGETVLSMESFKQFAQENQIGLVLVAGQTELFIIDPNSQRIIGKRALNLNTNDVMTPFYARFQQTDTSIFGLDRTYVPYFQSVAGLK